MLQKHLKTLYKYIFISRIQLDQEQANRDTYRPQKAELEKIELGLHEHTQTTQEAQKITLKGNNSGCKRQTYPSPEALRRLTDPPVLPGTDPHDVRVDSAGDTVLHLRVQLGESVTFKHHKPISTSSYLNQIKTNANQIQTHNLRHKKKKREKKKKKKIPSQTQAS